MNSTLRTLLLFLFVTVIAIVALRSFAQDSTEPSAPSAAQAAPAPALGGARGYIAKGPVLLDVTSTGQDLIMLHIVRRSHVVGSNIGRVALSVIGGSGQMHGKENYLGDTATDSGKPRNLISPLLTDGLAQNA